MKLYGGSNSSKILNALEEKLGLGRIVSSCTRSLLTNEDLEEIIASLGIEHLVALHVTAPRRSIVSIRAFKAIKAISVSENKPGFEALTNIISCKDPRIAVGPQTALFKLLVLLALDVPINTVWFSNFYGAAIRCNDGAIREKIVETFENLDETYVLIWIEYYIDLNHLFPAKGIRDRNWRAELRILRGIFLNHPENQNTFAKLFGETYKKAGDSLLAKLARMLENQEISIDTLVLLLSQNYKKKSDFLKALEETQPQGDNIQRKDRHNPLAQIYKDVDSRSVID